MDVFDLLILLGSWGPCSGCGGTPTLEQAIDNAGLTMQQWEDYVDVMMNGTQNDKDNWSCWFKRYVNPCGLACPLCPGGDPFDP